MAEEMILFPYASSEFFRRLKALMEEVIDAKAGQVFSMPAELSEKTLLKPREVCTVLRITKPTLYTLMKQGRLKSFKIGRSRYFARTDIEEIIRRQHQFGRNMKPAS